MSIIINFVGLGIYFYEDLTSTLMQTFYYEQESIYEWT